MQHGDIFPDTWKYIKKHNMQEKMCLLQHINTFCESLTPLYILLNIVYLVLSSAESRKG